MRLATYNVSSPNIGNVIMSVKISEFKGSSFRWKYIVKTNTFSTKMRVYFRKNKLLKENSFHNLNRLFSFILLWTDYIFATFFFNFSPLVQKRDNPFLILRGFDFYDLGLTWLKFHFIGKVHLDFGLLKTVAHVCFVKELRASPLV